MFRSIVADDTSWHKIKKLERIPVPSNFKFPRGGLRQPASSNFSCLDPFFLFPWMQCSPIGSHNNVKYLCSGTLWSMSSTHPLTATIVVFTVIITVCSNTHSGNTQIRVIMSVCCDKCNENNYNKIW